MNAAERSTAEANRLRRLVADLRGATQDMLARYQDVDVDGRQAIRRRVLAALAAARGDAIPEVSARPPGRPAPAWLADETAASEALTALYVAVSAMLDKRGNRQQLAHAIALADRALDA